MSEEAQGSAEATAMSAGEVFGRYVLVEAVGSGSMGEVWVAIDPELDRKIALKLLRSDRVAKAKDRARLLQEARAMARLRHPNVVTVHDVGEVEGKIFVAMEFVEGESLAEWIARGPHPWPEVLEVMRQAGAGLAAAHDAALVHRDFKPANAIIGGDGRVRVLDFGLARPEDSERELRLERDAEAGEGDPRVLRARPERRAKRVQGSPAYMAPEQHRGETVDIRSDLFSYCVTLFEALYGQRPFAGKQRLVVALAIIEGKVRDIPRERQAPAWIHKAVLRGLAPDPDQRFPDMPTLLRALERSPRSRRLRWAAGLGLGAVIATGVLSQLLPDRGDPCVDAGASVDAEAGHERREALRERLAEATWAEHAAHTLIAGLARRVDAWSQVRTQLCRDERAQRLSDRVIARRRECLLAQRERLSLVIELGTAAGAEPAVLDALRLRPSAALRSLGQAERCGELQVGGGEAAARVEDATRRAFERARVLHAMGLPELASEALGPLAEADDSDPALALMRAEIAADEGHLEAAEDLLHAAARASTRGRPELAAAAWLTLAELRVDGLERDREADGSALVADAALWLDYAGALLDDDAPPSLLLERANLLARLELAQAGAGPEAVTELDAILRALATAAELEADALVDLRSQALVLRAELRTRAGDSSGAREDREAARDLLRAALGPEHPLVSSAGGS